MTDILDRVSDIAFAPLTNTPLTSVDTTFEIADLPDDINNFADPGSIGYYAWVWNRTDYPHVGDAFRAGQAERVRVTARDVGLQTLTVTRDPTSPIDLNAAGVTYWLVAPMNANTIEQIDDRIFDLVGGVLTTSKNIDVPSGEFDNIDILAATPGVGLLNFYEDTASGGSAVTLMAPSSLAGDVPITLLDALPGGVEYLTIDASGIMGTSPATTALSLDDAYDFGGSGAGRVITADSGPVEIQGADGLQISTTQPLINFETSGAVYNWRMIASSVDTLLLQRGDQDADVSDDTFVNGLCLDGTNRRAGVNTGSPQDTLHVLAIGSASSRLRLQTSSSGDSSILLQNVATPTWEIGYDQSEGALVIGRLSFSNKALSILDTSARVGIGPDAPGTTRLLVTSVGDEVGVTIDTSGQAAEPALDFISDTAAASLHDHGDIRLSQRDINAINPDAGEFWYNHGTTRRFEFIAGNVRGVVAGCIAANSRSQRTISAGVLNPVGAVGNLVVESETGSSDTLDTITAEDLSNGAYFDGDVVILQALTGHTITVSHGTGNIHLNGGANKSLTNKNRLMLHYDTVDNLWYQLSGLMTLT